MSRQLTFQLNNGLLFVKRALSFSDHECISECMYLYCIEYLLLVFSRSDCCRYFESTTYLGDTPLLWSIQTGHVKDIDKQLLMGWCPPP